jgi:hypothetical protein
MNLGDNPLLRYSAEVAESGDPARERNRVGLCFACLHARKMASDRGSVFYRCALAETDPRFAKYPRLPVLQCSEFKPKD